MAFLRQRRQPTIGSLALLTSISFTLKTIRSGSQTTKDVAELLAGLASRICVTPEGEE